MIELIFGLLSSLVPIILNVICDKMDDKENEKKLEQLDNELQNLTESTSSEDVAVSWASHDFRMRALLREAKTKGSQKS